MGAAGTDAETCLDALTRWVFDRVRRPEGCGILPPEAAGRKTLDGGRVPPCRMPLEQAVRNRSGASWTEWVKTSPLRGNVLVFGLLLVVLISYFWFQIEKARAVFLADAKNHARLVADVIHLHARGALLSREVIDEILRILLGDTVRFVRYLDAVEPFVPEELTAFAEEAGLAGIAILRPGGTVAEGPAGWMPATPDICGETARLAYHPAYHLVLLASPGGKGGACVVAGVKTHRMEALQEEIGLSRVLNTLGGIEGIRYVRVEGLQTLDRHALAGVATPADLVSVAVLEQAGGPVAEVRMHFGGALLHVGLDAGPLRDLTRTLWRDFLVFCVVLALTGTFLSWLLYRQQLFHVEEVKAYEHRLSRQREEAALGRAAAAIAHEIRNPLNAMAMGLQRLQIEAGELLLPGHHELVTIVLKALRRTNGIVTGLLDYARPPAPRLRAVSLPRLVEETLGLYQQRFGEMGVTLRKRVIGEAEVLADPDLLGQVMDNLIRNAMEAQSQGGFLEVEIGAEDGFMVLRVRNGGTVPSREGLQRIFEPYFSTKARGGGLGLAISKRIVQAHGGRMEAALPGPGVIEIAAFIPLADQNATERREQSEDPRSR